MSPVAVPTLPDPQFGPIFEQLKAAPTAPGMFDIPSLVFQV